ncbi:hypothetical protein SDC9_155068 [bioreactor metagenome]|uniref:RNA polymerase sigma factor 70 region 4 type 2 domain-containing protein n=1 Tax=bioreactor metagenome TaxID=1076179 RepID=A0A645F2C7_9ZZZZ
MNKRKRNAQDPLHEISDHLQSYDCVENLILTNESKVELFQKLQALDEKTREVMYLRLTGELSFKEIGEILNKNETWARVTFYRAKQKLVKEEQE